MPAILGDRVTPATLKTLREALGLPVAWLAQRAGVQDRTVRYWESGSGRAAVPPDVSALILDQEALAARLVDEAVAAFRAQRTVEPASPVRLVRFVSDLDLARYCPELVGLPSTFHATVLARIRWALAPEGVEANAFYLRGDAYEAWLRATNQIDSAELRATWAAFAPGA